MISTTLTRQASPKVNLKVKLDRSLNASQAISLEEIAFQLLRDEIVEGRL